MKLRTAVAFAVALMLMAPSARAEICTAGFLCDFILCFKRVNIVGVWVCWGYPESGGCSYDGDPQTGECSRTTGQCSYGGCQLVDGKGSCAWQGPRLQVQASFHYNAPAWSTTAADAPSGRAGSTE